MIPLYKTLGYLGAVPFYLCAFGMLAFHDGWLASMFQTVIVVYAGLILAFMGGVHWPQSFPRSSEGQMLLSIGSSLLAFTLTLLALFSLYGGWFGGALHLIVMSLCLALYILGFVFMYAFDLQSLDQEDFPDDYMDFRMKVTIFVCIALLGALISLWM